MDERIKFSWIQTSGTGRSNAQYCDEEGCDGLIDTRKTKPLFGKVLCFDCRNSFELIMDDMKQIEINDYLANKPEMEQ